LKRNFNPLEETPPQQVAINLLKATASFQNVLDSRDFGGVYQCPEGVVRLVNAGIKISPGQTGTGVALIGPKGEDVSTTCAVAFVSWQDGINAKPYGLLSFMVPGGWWYKVLKSVDAVLHFWVEWDLGGEQVVPE
jgi:hypothetical protein